MRSVMLVTPTLLGLVLALKKKDRLVHLSQRGQGINAMHPQPA